MIYWFYLNLCVIDVYLDSEEDDNISLELVVNMISISIKADGELMKKCKILGNVLGL
ncbi:MAG: hypothetical protein HFG28_06180 [Eubacterium sp.]|nr:hypothetical protein [Eubacterium sp.]